MTAPCAGTSQLRSCAREVRQFHQHVGKQIKSLHLQACDTNPNNQRNVVHRLALRRNVLSALSFSPFWLYLTYAHHIPCFRPSNEIRITPQLFPLLVHSRDARAEPVDTAPEGPTTTSSPALYAPGISKGELFETPDFSLTVPAGFELLLEAAPAGPQKSIGEEPQVWCAFSSL